VEVCCTLLVVVLEVLCAGEATARRWTGVFLKIRKHFAAVVDEAWDNKTAAVEGWRGCGAMIFTV
jgi:hypothetical protein